MRRLHAVCARPLCVILFRNLKVVSPSTKDNMKSTHPFEPYIPADSEKLIIGTIPPPRFCKESYQLYENDVNFYYGSRDNYFWCILEEVYETKLEYSNTERAVQQRKDLLQKLKIGITDIVDSCIHSGDSAADSDLKEIKQKDIKSLLQKYPACIDYSFAIH